MAVGDWSEFLVKLVLGDTEKEWWGKFLVSVGAITSLQSEALAQALRSRWVHSEQLPPDSLELDGRDRGIPRYTGETNEQYQARSADCWDAWQYAGTNSTVETQLRLAGFTGATVITDDTAPGPNGEAAPYWSQYWVEVPLSTLQARPGWTNTPRWGSIVWGFFWWGTGALSVTDVRLFQAIVKKFGPNDWVCRGIRIGT